MNFKKGTPGYGLICGLVCVAAGILMLTIGFWRTLLIVALFMIGYFLGTVDNKGEFVKNTLNGILPNREEKVIDIRSELTKLQEEQSSREQASAESAPEMAAEQTKAADNEEN